MSEMRGAMAPDAQQLANVAAATYNPLFGPPPALAGTGAADPGVQQLATVGQPPPQAADDLDKDPIFGRMLRGETIPPAAAAAPSGGPAGGPAGPVSGGPPGPAGPSGYPYQTQVPPVPEGYQPVFNPMAMRQLAIQGQAAGVQLPAVEKDLATYDGGDQLYYNPQTGHSYLAPYAYGPKDPGRQAYEAQLKAGATATGTATGEAPYKQVTIKTTNAQGAPVELTMSGDDAARYLHGLGPGAPAGGPAGGPPPVPGGPPPGASAGPGGASSAPPGVSTPVAPPGLEDVGKAMGDMRDKARVAQNGLTEAKQLQLVLGQIANVGPGTDWAGRISAIMQRAGWSPDTLKAFGLPDASDVYAAQKLSTDLLLNRAKESFNKVTNMDLGTVRGATPSAEMPLGASRDLLGNVVIPQLWREAQRYTDMARNPAVWQSPAAFHQAYATWDANHPIENFQTGPPPLGSAPGAAPGAAPAVTRWIRDPTSGQLKQVQ